MPSGLPGPAEGVEMVRAERYGAFSVNSMGMARTPFPLSFSVAETDGTWLVTAAAAQAGELIDLLMRTANETIIVVDLATNSFVDDEFQQWPPSRIAAEQGVDCLVHPVGAWACGTCGIAEELLVMPREALPRFLDGSWSLYELSLVDVPEVPSPAQLDEIGLLLGTVPVGEPVLPRLKGSRLWFSGHDDCYLAVESTDPDLPGRILGRLLALLAGSSLLDTDGAESVQVPEPDGTLPQQLIRQSPHWVGTLGPSSASSVTIRLSALPQRWRLGQQPPEHPDHVATLDLADGQWRLDPVHGRTPAA